MYDNKLVEVLKGIRTNFEGDFRDVYLGMMAVNLGFDIAIGTYVQNDWKCDLNSRIFFPLPLSLIRLYTL